VFENQFSLEVLEQPRSGGQPSVPAKQFKNELDEIQHVKPAPFSPQPSPGPFLTLSTDGKALPNINQIPVFAAGSNVNTQPKPQPSIQFEPSPVKFGSRKISREPVRIQTPQAEPERVRSQQVEVESLNAATLPLPSPLPLHQRKAAVQASRQKPSRTRSRGNTSRKPVAAQIPQDTVDTDYEDSNEFLPRPPSPNAFDQPTRAPRPRNLGQKTKRKRVNRLGSAQRVQVLERYSFENDDGSLTWGYENADGSFKEETIGTDCVTQGSYGYVDDSGEVREYTYESGIQCDPLTKQPLFTPAQQASRSSQQAQEPVSVARSVGHFDYRTNRFVKPNGRRLKVVVNKNNRRRG